MSAKKFEMIDDATAEILRRMTEAERLAIAFRMWDFARDMLRANIRADHPEWTEEQVNRAAASRMSHGVV